MSINSELNIFPEFVLLPLVTLKRCQQIKSLSSPLSVGVNFATFDAINSYAGSMDRFSARIWGTRKKTLSVFSPKRKERQIAFKN